MHPLTYLVLREYRKFAAEERRGNQSRRADSSVAPNDITVEQALQGRLTAACARLRERLPSSFVRRSRPAEPSGV